MSLTFDPDRRQRQRLFGGADADHARHSDSVTAPAQPQVNTPTTIVFPDVHVGGTDSQHVSVTNAAPSGAANLDVTLTPSGNATASGSITDLAPGATDATDLTVGINTSTAGALSGSVTENFVSDLGGGNTSAISEQDPYIDLFGDVYRLADPSISPNNLTVHVGASGTQSLTITNLDPNDGYSENLIATVVGTTGAVTAKGATGDIAPQAYGTLSVNFSTATPGTIGTVTLDLKSDGTGIDGLGVTDLGDVTIPVIVTTDNVPAAAQFEEISGGGTFTQNGSAYNLNLGTITAPTSVNLGVLNSAIAPADDLGGTFTTSGPTEFAVTGFSAFSGVASGAADTAPTVTLFAGVAGTFTEIITLQPTDTTTNTALPDETLTITGTVSTAAPPVITAPSSVMVQQSQASPVSGISITDPDAISGDQTVTVILFDGAGLLTANTSASGGGGTITGAGTTALTVSGTLTQVNADLTTLMDTDITTATDSILVGASDSVGGVATPATITVSVNAPPVITAPSAVLVQQSQASAVAGISIADADAVSAGETITATLTDSDGLLSANTSASGGGGTITGAGTTSLTIAGTLTQVNADLSTLTDNDSSLAADSIAVNANDGRGGVAVQQPIAVSVNALPVITAPSSVLVQQSQASPVSGISITDPAAISGNQTVTVSLFDGAGLLTANTSASGGGGTITGAGTTALTVSGTLSQVNADLTTLTDTDMTTASDSIVVDASDSVGGVAKPATITVSVNAPPVITAPSSVLVQQSQVTAVADVSIADADAVSANETITATLTDSNGLLTANTSASGGGGTITGAGTTSLTIAGTLTQVNADLSTLTDNDSSLAADSIAVNANDGRGGVAVQQSITVSVNAPPVITAPTSVLVQQSQATAVADVSIADADAVSAGETITATLTDSNGLLTANTSASGGGGNITGVGTTSLTIAGTLTQVNADLSTLTDNDSSLAADSIAVNANDGRGGVAVQQSITVSVNAPPVITAPSSVLVQQSQATAVADVSIADADAVSAGETITATLTDSAGLLSANTSASGGGGTITGAGTTSLTIAGTLTQVNADLSTLTDNDSSLAADNIAVNANDGRGGVAVQQSIAVSVNAPPVITAPTSVLVQQSQASAVANVSIADADAVSAGETITATLTDSNGLLTANTSASGGGGTITGVGTTSLTIAGTLTQVNADLSTLTDNDSSLAADSIAVNANDGRGGVAVQQSITVSVNAPPVITAPTSVLVQQSQASAVADVSIADADAVSANETITATLSDSDGLLSANTSANGGGGSITGAGTTSLTIAGTLTQVNADLSTLTDNDSSLAADSIAVNANDGRGGVAVQQSIAVTVSSTSVNVTINPVDGNNVINNTEAHAVGGVPVTGTETGLAIGTMFTVTVTDGSFSRAYAATVGSNGSWATTISSTDAVKLPNGKATVTAQANSVQVSEQVTVAETLPTVTINKINGNDVINNEHSICGEDQNKYYQCASGYYWSLSPQQRNDCLVFDNGQQQSQSASAVILSGSVSGIAANSTFQVTVSDGTFSGSCTATVNAAGTSWTATIPASQVAELPNGAARVTAQVTDQYGNTSLPAVQLVTVEGTTPIVLSVAASPTTGDLDAGKTVVITLTMNEAVEVKGCPTLTMNDCGTAIYDSAHSTPTSLVFDYTVAAGQNTPDLAISALNLPHGSSIADADGDAADLSGALVPLGLQVDTTAPTVCEVVASPRSGEVMTGQTVRITLDMSKSVQVSGSPILLLNDDGSATFDAAQSTATALAFNYTVAAGQATKNLAISGVEYPSNSSIEDHAGNNANLSGADVSLGLSVNNTAAVNHGNCTIDSGVELVLFGPSAANVTCAVGGAELLILDDFRAIQRHSNGTGAQRLSRSRGHWFWVEHQSPLSLEFEQH